jgi:integrase
MRLVPSLTDKTIKNLPPKDRPYKIFDGRGLYIEVLPSGTKSWRFKYHVNNQEKVHTFGQYPSISLKEAREMTDAMRLKIKNGDLIPSEEPNIPQPTIKDLCSLWADTFDRTYSKPEANRRISYIERYILPPIGDLPVADLSPMLILKSVLRPVQDSASIFSAHKVKNTLSQMLRFGVANEIVPRDFTADLQSALLPIPQTVHRAAIVEPDKIGKLMFDINNYPGSPVLSAALKVLGYTFVRTNELRFAEWSDFDFDNSVWRIPAGKMKMNLPHLVPLSTQMKDILAWLKPISGNRRYLFPNRTDKAKPFSNTAILYALRLLGYKQGEMCGHGFRAMASTRLNEMGYSSDWIEKQLAHTERNSVRAAYNHADYFSERAKMMQVWADYLDELADKAAQRISSLL